MNTHIKMLFIVFSQNQFEYVYIYEISVPNQFRKLIVVTECMHISTQDTMSYNILWISHDANDTRECRQKKIQIYINILCEIFFFPTEIT